MDGQKAIRIGQQTIPVTNAVLTGVGAGKVRG